MNDDMKQIIRDYGSIKSIDAEFNTLFMDIPIETVVFIDAIEFLRVLGRKYNVKLPERNEVEVMTRNSIIELFDCAVSLIIKIIEKKLGLCD